MLKGNPLGSIEDRQGLGIKNKTSEVSVPRVSESSNRGSCKPGNVNRQHSSRSRGVGQIHSNTMQSCLVGTLPRLQGDIKVGSFSSGI